MSRTKSSAHRWLWMAMLLLCTGAATSAERWHFRADYDAAFSGGQYAKAEEIASKAFHSIATPADFNNPTHVEAARMLAHIRGWKARYEEARLLLRAIANWFAKHPDTDPTQRATTYGQLAGIHRELHEFADADRTIALALDTVTNADLGGSELHARILVEKVTALTDQSRHFEALQATSHLLHVRQQLHGANDPRVARTLLTINRLTEHPLRVPEMQRRHAQAASILQDAYQRGAPTKSASIANLVALHEAQYPPEQAAVDQICILRSQLLRTLEDTYGQQSFRLIEPLSAFAQGCSDAMSDQEILALNRRALAIADATLSVDHPVTISLQRELAEALRISAWNRDEEPPPEARELDAVALQNTERLFGERSPIAAYLRFTELLRGQQECVFADGSCAADIEQQLAVVQEAAGEAHPYIALLRQRAAEELEQTLEFDTDDERVAKSRFLLQLSKVSVAALAKFYDPLHPQFGEAAANHGRRLLQDEQADAATAYLQQAHAAYVDYFGELDPLTIALWQRYASASIKAKQFDQAQAEIERALDTLKTDSADHLNALQGFLDLRTELQTSKRFQ